MVPRPVLLDADEFAPVGVLTGVLPVLDAGQGQRVTGLDERTARIAALVLLVAAFEGEDELLGRSTVQKDATADVLDDTAVLTPVLVFVVVRVEPEGRQQRAEHDADEREEERRCPSGMPGLIARKRSDVVDDADDQQQREDRSDDDAGHEERIDEHCVSLSVGLRGWYVKPFRGNILTQIGLYVRLGHLACKGVPHPIQVKV